MNRRDLLKATGLLGLPLPTLAALRPTIAIIMDDLGYRHSASYAALELNKAVTLAILPHTVHSEALADGARAFEHEVMLHLPMQAQNGKFMGPGGLAMEMAPSEIRANVAAGFDNLGGHARGFNNHMGSALTASKPHMRWVMDEAREHCDYFIDSITSADSVALDAAKNAGLACARRDLFLDDALDELSVVERFETLLLRQQQTPQVVICHPRDETLDFLSRQWAWIEDHYDVVPASAVTA